MWGRRVTQISSVGLRWTYAHVDVMRSIGALYEAFRGRVLRLDAVERCLDWPDSKGKPDTGRVASFSTAPGVGHPSVGAKDVSPNHQAYRLLSWTW